MAEIIKLDGTIPEESDGLRLDQALAQLFPDFSRGQLSKWIKAGDVLLNEVTPKPRDKVRVGDNVIINAELQVQDEQWQAVLDNNLSATFYYCRAAAKAMLRTGGSIINISSVVGIRGNAGQVNYSASGIRKEFPSARKITIGAAR